MEELIKNSLQGDQNAYTELIKIIQIDMYKIANSQLNNIDDINDAIQETIIHSYNKLHTLKSIDYFKTWIIRILINECNTIHRKRKKQLSLFYKITNSIEHIPSAEKGIQNKEKELDFDILISHLNKEERLLLTLYYKNKYTPTEISKILNININTIKSKILRAKQKLQKLYNKEGGINNDPKK